MMLTMTCRAKVTGIKKRCFAKMFDEIEVGDIIEFSIPVQAVGTTRDGSKAAYISCLNINTKDYAEKTFNQIEKTMECFEFEPIIPTYDK